MWVKTMAWPTKAPNICRKNGGKLPEKERKEEYRGKGTGTKKSPVQKSI